MEYFECLKNGKDCVFDDDEALYCKKEDICPDCGAKMIYAEGCKVCPVCGYSPCK